MLDDKSCYQKRRERYFSGGPVTKTPCSQCRGPGFNPWPGNLIPCAATKEPACCNYDPT